MGGPGSGNFSWRSQKKRVVEECLTLDTSGLWRGGLLAGLQSSGEVVWTLPSGNRRKLNYRINSLDPEAAWLELEGLRTVSTVIRLTTTVPPLGGRRWWFECPYPVAG